MEIIMSLVLSSSIAYLISKLDKMESKLDRLETTVDILAAASPKRATDRRE